MSGKGKDQDLDACAMQDHVFVARGFHEIRVLRSNDYLSEGGRYLSFLQLAAMCSIVQFPGQGQPNLTRLL